MKVSDDNLTFCPTSIMRTPYGIYEYLVIKFDHIVLRIGLRDDAAGRAHVRRLHVQRAHGRHHITQPRH